MTALQGKAALVTGGGRGIGRGIVERFREEGATVAVVQRGELDPDWQTDAQVVHAPANLADVASIPDVVNEAVERLGGLDILVNNAGMMVQHKVTDITVEDWDLMMALNLRAPLFLAQAAVPHMRERGGGSIINIGSIEGLGANPEHAAYATSKAGIHGLTRALAIDLGADSIRCNAIAPGWIDSDLSQKYLDSLAPDGSARTALERLHPLGRTGGPRDVGDLAVYLAGDTAGFLTGQVIVLDGGRTSKLSLPTP